MNIKLLVKIISILLLIVSGFMIFPIIAACYYGESHIIKYFVIPIVISLIFFIIIKIITLHQQQKALSTKGGFIFVALSWITVSLLGAIPYYFSGYFPSFTDSFFESISGFTTTGATILSDIEALPKAILFWRGLTQWLGGMGIVVLTVAIFPLLGIGGLQLIRAEAPGPSVDKITPKIAGTAKILWFTYIAFTVIQTILLVLGGLNFFDALTHTFATLATGGFSPRNGSLGYYNSAFVDWVTMLFMLMGGINFIVYFKLITGKFQSIARSTELKAYLTIFIVSTLIIAFNLHGNNLHGNNLNGKSYETIGNSLRFAGFQAASIMTTTGFITGDYKNWPMLSQAIIFILMFVGGCSGSTGGGIKVIRIVTLVKQGINEIKLLIRPRGIYSIRIDKKVVKKRLVYSVSGFVILYFFFIFFLTVITASGNHDLFTSFSAAVSAIGNVGPGFGKIGPINNYGFFQEYIKWFLSFGMLAGRLEIYTVLALFLPTFWKK